MRIMYFIILFFLSTTSANAQSGKINGNVINGSSGQSLLNATLTIVEKSKTVFTDQNGNFSFNSLPAGTYSLKCTYTGHIDKIIEGIVVIEKENTFISISLQEKKAGAVIVTAKINARLETSAATLIAQKNSANVSDAISAEAIKKTPDRSTSDVIKRVSGASIQDDRFAVIRGLNDRYNAAFINGAPLPSTESDRKAFAFDIFPSSILDNLVIYKTATPDKSGEFAGGIIDITTKSTLPKKFTSLSYGVSYNNLITGNTRYYSEIKGKMDWLGIDDGTRALPIGMPSTKEIKALSAENKGEAAKLFENYGWGIKDGTTKPNTNFQISKGFNIRNKEADFMGVLFSVTYNRNYTFNEGDRSSFDANLDTPSNPIVVQRAKYKDSIYNDEVVLAGLGNFSFKINNRNNISWKNNLSINTDNKFIKRIGPPDYSDEPTSFTKQKVRWFTYNQIYSSQLIGEHQIGSKKTKINWLAAYSSVNREIPNLARTAYSGNYPDLESVSASTASGSGNINQFAGHGTMFFANSKEDIKSGKIDVTQPFTFLKNTQNFIKIGGGYQKRARNFDSRLLGFTTNENSQASFDNSLKVLSDDQIFLPQHLGKLQNGKGGWALDDGTLPNSNYTASSTTTHFYAMSDQRFFKKYRLIYGVRMEKFTQKLNTIKNLADTVNLNTVKTDFLPSLNLVYSLTPKMNIRLSYSETVNRPEFREIADFIFFEYVTNLSYSGREDLKRTKINNYDFRYEFYPGKAQLFSVSAFYKKFSDPIEVVQLPNTTGQTTYINSASANVYGIETEFRILLSSLFGIKNENSITSKFTLSGNAAFTKSTIKDPKVDNIPASQLITDRPLLGQSPYILNGSLGYSNDKIGLSSTLSLNRVGDRIFIAGTFNTADIYEKARTVIDFQLAKFLLKNSIELKFNVRDILARNLDFYFDFDKTKSYSNKDKFFSSTRAPRNFSFSATLKL